MGEINEKQVVAAASDVLIETKSDYYVEFVS